MNQHANTDKAFLEDLRKTFEAAIDAIWDALDKYAFRNLTKITERNPKQKFASAIHPAIFDALMIATAKKGREPQKLETNGAIDKYKRLLEEDFFIDCITQRTTNVDKIIKRVSLAEQFSLKIDMEAVYKETLDDCSTELESIKSRVNKDQFDSMVKFLQRYAIIKACGTIETVVKSLIADHVEQHALPETQQYLETKVRDSSTNPKTSINTIIRYFDDARSILVIVDQILSEARESNMRCIHWRRRICGWTY